MLDAPSDGGSSTEHRCAGVIWTVKGPADKDKQMATAEPMIEAQAVSKIPSSWSADEAGLEGNGCQAHRCLDLAMLPSVARQSRPKGECAHAAWIYSPFPAFTHGRFFAGQSVRHLLQSMHCEEDPARLWCRACGAVLSLEAILTADDEGLEFDVVFDSIFPSQDGLHRKCPRLTGQGRPKPQS